MVCNNNFIEFKKGTPHEVIDFVVGCQSNDDLMKKLGEDSLFLILIIQNMQLSEKSEPLAARLLSKVDSKDLKGSIVESIKAVEKTLRNNGRLIPPGTFGKAEWEAHFQVTIEKVPPLPPGINKILEEKDPWDSGQVKDNFTLFLVPEKVIVEKDGKKEIVKLTMKSMEGLAKRATNGQIKFWTLFRTDMYFKGQTIEKSRWVLMRKDVIPGSRNKSLDDQIKLLQGTNYDVPMVLDAIVLILTTYISTGKVLYDGSNFTRCQEYTKNNFGEYVQSHVGGFMPPQLAIDFGKDDREMYGMGAVRDFGSEM